MTLGQKVMARLYDRSMKNYELHAASYREKLLGDLEGHTVELGPGTGVNLEYIASAAKIRPVQWTGVEPSAPMRAKLRTRAARDHPDLPLQFADLVHGKIQLPAGAVDTVICTLVLCSIKNQAATLREVHRILKPGGRFLFMEHVAAKRGSLRRVVQNTLAPFWGVLADGCKLNRETWLTLESVGFSDLAIEHYDAMGMPWFGKPHIIGSAIK